MKQLIETSRPCCRKAQVVVLAIALLTLALVLLLAGCTPKGGGAAPAGATKSSTSTASTASSSKQVFSNVAEPSRSSSSASSSQASVPAVTNQQVESDITSLAQQSGMTVGVSVIDLASGATADYQGDTRMVSASMIKLAVAAAFLEQVEAGKYSLDETYTLQASDIVGGTGVIGGYGAGAEFTYGELLNKMISASDNTATNILVNEIGMDAVNAEARKLGLEQTEMNRLMMDEGAMAAGIENYTSANDVAKLLAMVQRGTFVSKASSALVLEALRGQQDAGGIQGGLPAGVEFAHKTGSLPTVRHDGGIVEAQKPFVLVVMCGGSGFSASDALATMASIASAVYADLS